MAKRDIIIGEIGNNFRKLVKINFDSDQSLLDFDLVFLDLNYISTLVYDSGGKGHPYSEETFWVSENKNKILDKRREELQEYVMEGRILVIFLPKPQMYQFLDGRYSTGKTFLNTDVSPRDLLLNSIEGVKMDVIPKTKFTKILNKFEQILCYKSSFQKNAVIGTPIAKIKGTDKVIASFEENLFFIPSLTPQYYGETQVIDSYCDELVELLIPTAPDYSLPIWAENYLLPGEDKLLIKKNEQVEKLKKIEEEIAKLDDEYIRLNQQKILLSGTGNSLEEAVSNIFKSLGIEILETEINRDDLIIKYKGRIAVVEIKGVTKSATEEHAMQLEKWVTEYSLEKKIVPKGILIVNTFRDLELSKRTGIDFPDQMKKFSLKRDHCLLTATQLLGLYYDCINHPQNKDTILNSIFETIGELSEYKDWQKFIEMK